MGRVPPTEDLGLGVFGGVGLLVGIIDGRLHLFFKILFSPGKLSKTAADGAGKFWKFFGSEQEDDDENDPKPFGALGKAESEREGNDHGTILRPGSPEARVVRLRLGLGLREKLEPEGFAGGIQGGKNRRRGLGHNAEGRVRILQAMAGQGHSHQASLGNPSGGEGFF